MDTSRRPHSIFWPLLLIGLGLFLFLKTLGYIGGQTGETLLRLWPLLFIVGGLDSLYRRESFVAPVLMIGIGVVILLSNFGYIQVSNWLVFLRLWPVLLIAWGLDLLIGRRGVWSAVLGVLLGLALIAGIVLFSISQPQVGVPPTNVQINQDLQGATEAVVDINAAAGELNVAQGAGPGLIASGELHVPAGTNLDDSYTVTNQRGVYTINTGEMGVMAPFFSTRDYPWKLALSGAIPLDVQSSLAVGEQHIDLTGMNLTHLETETVIGRNVVTLPENGSFDGSANVVIGSLLIYVPRGAPVQFQLDTAITSISYPPDFTRDGNLVTAPGAQGAANPITIHVNVPIGGVQVEYAP